LSSDRARRARVADERWRETYDERVANVFDRKALVALGRALQAADYSFVTVTPETHRRVNARAAAAGRSSAENIRDVFGWSRPFAPDVLPAPLLALATQAAVVATAGDGLLRSTVRFSSIGERLFVHSAYPTHDAQAVFFGPDTYRFSALIEDELARGPRARRAIDVGCGSGAGGIVASVWSDRIVLGDINETALEFAAVNAALAGVDTRAELIVSDVLASVSGEFDVVLANPPYLVDPASRAYRHGGGAHGEELAVRIARESLARLASGGRLVLYTGAAIVDGVDTFLRAVEPVCCEAKATLTYRELDPDVFGEEIEQNDAYVAVERIAAVALVATR
jgi:methylase of polypeptide subunit release factors